MSKLNSQKVGSDSESSRGRLQPSRRAERDFFVKEEKQGSGRMTFLHKKVEAKRTLLRRGASDGT